MKAATYAALGRMARRHARRRDEVDDLVQDALIVAIGNGRTNLDDAATQRWLAGVMRNQAAARARAAARRQHRETSWQLLRPEVQPPELRPPLEAILCGLPPSLKAVAALALSGHNRREIAYLLKLSDTALRQRVRALKRQLRGAGGTMPEGLPGLNLDLSYGRIRAALLPLLLRHGGNFASHDPDGHPFVVCRRS